MVRAIGFLSTVLILVFVSPGKAAAATVTVPFVGCEADGMSGHEAAPNGKPVAVNLDPHIAARLAYYQVGSDFGVLAPRGWYWADIYGSNGGTLYVASHPVKIVGMLYEHPFVGPVVQMDFINGYNSSRFEVAHFAARYFPEQRALVSNAIAEEKEDGISMGGPYVSSPYPADRLVSHKKGIVEYITPPHAEGLGTQCWLKPDDEPILSAAILMPEDGPSVMAVAVRLPKDMADLAPVILHQAEQQYSGAK